MLCVVCCVLCVVCCVLFVVCCVCLAVQNLSQHYESLSNLTVKRKHALENSRELHAFVR